MLTKYRNGFTIVELAIVIVVIGILATLGTVGFNGAQSRAINTLSQSDGTNAADQIELLFLKAGKFPSSESELSSIKKDANTDWEYVTNVEKTAYCLEIWNTKPGSKHYTVKDDKNIAEGTCDGWVPSTGTLAPVAPSDPSPTVASITSTSFVFSWSAVSGAQNYNVHLGTTTSSGVPNGWAPGCAPTTALSCTITGLSPNTTYYVGLSATVSGGSNYYGYQNARTSGVYVGSAPGPMIACAYPSGGVNVGWNKTAGAAKLHLFINGGYDTIDEELNPDPNYPNLFTYDFGQGGGGTITATVSFIDSSGNESSTTTSSVTINATDCYN